MTWGNISWWLMFIIFCGSLFMSLDSSAKEEDKTRFVATIIAGVLFSVCFYLIKVELP